MNYYAYLCKVIPQYTTVEIQPTQYIINMTKHISLQHSGEYESPKCTVLEFALESTILSGGDYGAPGMPGSDLDVLDEIVY